MKFYNIFKSYFSRNGVAGLDRAKVLIHYPLFRLMQSLEYGKPIEKKAAKLIHGFFREYRVKYKVKSAALGQYVDVTIPFERYGFSSFMEVCVAEAYRPPFELSQVGTIVDLGGNTGMASLYFLTRYHGVRKVLVVEANPGLIGAIKSNLRDFDGIVTIKNACIAGRSGDEIRFAVSSNHRESRMNVEADQAGLDVKEVVRVPSVTLRQLLDDNELDRVDLLKMDIEGAEFEILSDPEILKKFRYMVIEVHGDLEKRDRFIGFVRSAGFALADRSYDDTFQCETIFCYQSPR